MHFLIFSSVCFPLPVTPTAALTCHPCRRLSLLIVDLLLLLFSRPSLLVTCHPLLLALLQWFSPFKSTPHNLPLIRALSCPPLGGGVAVVTAKTNDRQGPMATPPLRLWNTTHTCRLPTNIYDTSVTRECTNSNNVEVSYETSFDVSPLSFSTFCGDVHAPYFSESTQEFQLSYTVSHYTVGVSLKAVMKISETGQGNYPGNTLCTCFII